MEAANDFQAAVFGNRQPQRDRKDERRAAPDVSRMDTPACQQS